MSVRFEVTSFELVRAAPGTALLRIAGGWHGSVRERLAPPMLVVDDGRRSHRLSALPGPDEATPLCGPDAPPWRAAFAAPEALLGSRPAFALDVGRGGLIDLPRPGARTVRAAATAPAPVPPAPAPTPDVQRDASDHVSRERARLAAAEAQRRKADERERERLRAVRAEHLAAQQARQAALAAAERERAQRDEAAARERAARAEAERAHVERQQAETTRAQQLREAADRREAELRAAEAQRIAEFEQARAQLEADRARAQAATEVAAQRAAELERRIEGYRDMLAQATEALTIANGRIEADAQDLSDALDAAAAASAQREQAQAEAQSVRARLVELETEHERTLRRASAVQSDLVIERDRVAELEEAIEASERKVSRLREQALAAGARSADAAEIEALRAQAEGERAIADRLRAAYSQESAARDAEVLAWHSEWQAALTRASQLADALSVARGQLERMGDGDQLDAGPADAPARGLVRFARDD